MILSIESYQSMKAPKANIPVYIIRPNARTKTKWDVLNTNTKEVVATFPNNGGAHSYAQRCNRELKGN